MDEHIADLYINVSLCRKCQNAVCARPSKCNCSFYEGNGGCCDQRWLQVKCSRRLGIQIAACYSVVVGCFKTAWTSCNALLDSCHHILVHLSCGKQDVLFMAVVLLVVFLWQ